MDGFRRHVLSLVTSSEKGREVLREVLVPVYVDPDMGSFELFPYKEFWEVVSKESMGKGIPLCDAYIELASEDFSPETGHPFLRRKE